MVIQRMDHRKWGLLIRIYGMHTIIACPTSARKSNLRHWCIDWVGGERMELKRNQITVGELLDHPGSRAVLQRRFPMLFKHPILGAARSITLEQILSVAQAYVSQKKIDETLNDLRRA